MRFQGRRALVTGASSGVGRAVAVLLASEGAELAIHYRSDAASAEKTATACGMTSGQVPVVIRADLSQFDEGERVVEEAAAGLGGLDLLVHAAGCGDPAAWSARLDEVTEELWRAVVGTDLTGAFTTARTAGRLMQQRGGAIALVASTMALTGRAASAAHIAARAGALGLSRALARELAPRVRVNAVALGGIASRWMDGLEDEDRRAVLEETPLGRLGRPEDAARAILYLLSDDAGFVTGQTLVIDGGRVMR